MSLDAAHFREGMSRFTTGVCVVTTVDDDGVPAGVTISSFASVSLKPPLVLFCIGKSSTELAAWLNARHFSVNVLGAGQQAICELFASHVPDKFATVRGTTGGNGCFQLAGALATLECRRTGAYDEGDHHIVLGEVERVVLGDNSGPLLRFRAAYRRLDAAARGDG